MNQRLICDLWKSLHLQKVQNFVEEACKSCAYYNGESSMASLPCRRTLKNMALWFHVTGCTASGKKLWQASLQLSLFPTNKDSGYLSAWILAKDSKEKLEFCLYCPVLQKRTAPTKEFAEPHSSWGRPRGLHSQKMSQLTQYVMGYYQSFLCLKEVYW